MALIEIPTRKDLPIYQYRVQLDGTTYILLFRWNSRINLNAGKWFLSIYDAGNNPIITSVPIIATWPILNRFKDTRLPPGLLFPFDSSNTNTDPGRYELGDRVRLFYQEANA